MHIINNGQKKENFGKELPMKLEYKLVHFRCSGYDSNGIKIYSKIIGVRIRARPC